PRAPFSLAGAGSSRPTELARFAHRYRRRLILVSRFYATANLYAPPPARCARPKAGRPRTKGLKQPAPHQVVASATRQRLRVRWYGGGTPPRGGGSPRGPLCHKGHAPGRLPGGL